MSIDRFPTAMKTGVVITAMALTSCTHSNAPDDRPSVSDQRQFHNKGQRQIPPIPAELKPALIAIRRGDAWQADQLLLNRMEVLNSWLSKAIVKGESTRDDVIELLGPHLQDLDRPQRDQIVTQQYDLGTYGASTTLVFDFDAETGVVSDWSTSQAVCGFCPHVFANDGRWRLEGKLLAGCINANQEGTDTILLPRLVERAGRMQVKLANLAPEIEYLDQVQLGIVPLHDDEELDVGYDGNPYVWRVRRELDVEFESTVNSTAASTVDLPLRSLDEVVVLEARNTSAFEEAMRESVFGQRNQPVPAEMQIDFAAGDSVQIEPVGTKFLQRIVIPVPAEAKQLRLEVHPEMWLVRRIWFGTGGPADSRVEWHVPLSGHGTTPEASTLLSEIDQKRLTLEPMQNAVVTFGSSDSSSAPARKGYILRLTGYYEFQRRADIGVE